MSIILKGIDMPNCSNEDCIVVIRHDKAEVWQTGYKERTVEAIQIPTPHGRLIDGDRLIRNEIDRFLYHLNNGDTAVPKIDIINAPTIIEAEKE